MLLELGSQLVVELLIEVGRDEGVKELMFVLTEGSFPFHVLLCPSFLSPGFLYLSFPFLTSPFGALLLLQPQFWSML